MQKQKELSAFLWERRVIYEADTFGEILGLPGSSLESVEAESLTQKERRQLLKLRHQTEGTDDGEHVENEPLSDAGKEFRADLEEMLNTQNALRKSLAKEGLEYCDIADPNTKNDIQQLIDKDPTKLNFHEKDRLKNFALQFIKEGGIFDTIVKAKKDTFRGEKKNDFIKKMMASFGWFWMYLGKSDAELSIRLTENFTQNDFRDIAKNEGDKLVTIQEEHTLGGLEDDDTETKAIRDMIEHAKSSLLKEGQDSKFAVLGEIIENNGVPSTAEESKNARQLILDLTAEDNGYSYSPDKLEKKIGEWKQSAGKLKGEKRENKMKDMLNDNHQWVSQMAGYEIAKTAERLMIQAEARKWRMRIDDPKQQESIKKSLFEDPIAKKILREGRGHVVWSEKLTKKEMEERYKNANSRAHKIMDQPGGIITYLITQVGGFMMMALNGIILVQSNFNNPQAVAYMAAGAGMMYGGTKAVDQNWLNSWMHPENKVFNTLGNIINEDRHLLDEYANNIEFYKTIDLSKQSKEKFFNITNSHIETENKELKKQIKQDKAQGNTPPEYKTHQEEVSIKDLSEGGRLESILIDGSNIADVASRLDLKDNHEINYRRYRAIAWLYKNHLTNGDLEQLSYHAKNIRKLNPNDPLTYRLLGVKYPG